MISENPHLQPIAPGYHVRVLNDKQLEQPQTATLEMLESCTLLYPKAIILDSDIYHQVRIEADGLDTNSEALALDVIKEVDPRGHFLRHKHTSTHMRMLEFSGLTAQPNQYGGNRDPIDVACEKVDWILENHHPQPLEDIQKTELRRIIQVAEQDIG